MSEILMLQDITVNYDEAVSAALKRNGFIEFRTHPKFRDDPNFRSKFTGKQDAMAHFFKAPAGCFIPDLPGAMQDRILRPPRDIREVIAVGETLKEETVEFMVFAPEITGADDKFIQIVRYPEWTGLGLNIIRIETDETNLWDLELIGFSHK